MKLLVTVQHPAHVHFFRPVVGELRDAGHEVAVYAREKDVAADLLDAHGVDHEVLAGDADSAAGLPAVQARWEWRLLRAARREDPDVLTGIGGLAAAHVAAAIGARSVVFTDTETPANWLAAPLADVVCTPRAFDGSLGAGHLRYDGFQELAYLHPDRFEPDGDALRAAGVEPDEPFAVCRFSRLAAHHDVGETGLSPADRRALVADLGERGPVYVSDEGGGELPAGAEPLPVPPHRLHDLLAAADLVVTDGATTAAEAGLLGTPTVRVGGAGLGNFVELERRGLVRSFPDPDGALALAGDLADDSGAAATWARRRERLLAETVDVADFAAGVLVAAGPGGPDGRPADASDVVRPGTDRRATGGEDESAADGEDDPPADRRDAVELPEVGVRG